ncbi:hypothetical protein [Pedobacter psychrodurus]|uniref:hypothetical protein n=1 Tax=Pedobacter psychrodurus TaxID=2530456 RepID=UPI0029301C0B|nr:hypothetical protein [Pedobacter psychrodurus]
MTVILKKNEKVGKIISDLPEGSTIDQFISKFIEEYPIDWLKIQNSFLKHTKNLNPGKKQPMPEPMQYLINAYNVFTKANK